MNQSQTQAWRSVESLIGKRIGAGTYGFVHEQTTARHEKVIKVYKQNADCGPCGPLLREWAVLVAMNGKFNCLPAYNLSVFPRYTLILPRCAPLWPGALLYCKGGEQNEIVLQTLQNCAFDIVLQLRAMKTLSGVEHRDIKPNNVVASVWKDGTRRPASKTDRIDTWCFHLIDYGATKHSCCYPTGRVTTHIYRAPEKLFFQTLFDDDNDNDSILLASQTKVKRDSGINDDNTKFRFPTTDSNYWSARFDTRTNNPIRPTMKMRQTHKVDVWSLGVVLFELATGEFFVPLDIWSFSHTNRECVNGKRKKRSTSDSSSSSSSSSGDLNDSKSHEEANKSLHCATDAIAFKNSEKKRIEKQVFSFILAQRDKTAELPEEWIRVYEELLSVKNNHYSNDQFRNMWSQIPIACKKERWQTRLKHSFELLCENDSQYRLLEDFLTHCLQLNPRHRANLTECWTHPFISLVTDSSLSLSRPNRELRRNNATCLHQKCKRRIDNDIKRKKFTVPVRIESLVLIRYLFDVGCDVGLRCHTIFAALRLLEKCMCDGVKIDDSSLWYTQPKLYAHLCLRLASKMCGDNGLDLPVARQRVPLVGSCTAQQEKTLFIALLPHLCESVRFNMWSCAASRTSYNETHEDNKKSIIGGCETSWLQTPHIGATEQNNPHSLFCSLRRACLEPLMWNKTVSSIVEAVLWARAVQEEVEIVN